MLIEMTLKFTSETIVIRDKFTIIDQLSHDVILGDSLLAKANLVSSRIPEIQTRLDIAKHKCTAEIEIFNFSLIDKLDTNIVLQDSSLERDLITLQLEYQGKLINLDKLNDDDDDDKDIPATTCWPQHVQLRAKKYVPPTSSQHLSFQAFFDLAHNNLQEFERVEADLRKADDSLPTRGIVFKLEQLNHLPLCKRVAAAFLQSHNVHNQTFQNVLGSALMNVPPMDIERDPAHKDTKIFCQPRATSAEIRTVIKDNLENMLVTNVIRPATDPKMISPVHVVKYANKKPRFTIG